MTTKPLVSVVIPTFQRSEYLIRAIESVLDQTYQNIEIIVVDDNDGENEYRKTTQDNVRNYTQSGRITYLKHNQNKGLPAARNTGIRISKGEYVAFLDDDDVWLPTKIEKQIDLFSKIDDSYGAVASYWKVIDEFDKKEVTRKLKHRGDLSKILALNHFAPPSMVIVKKKYLDRVNSFDENFRWRQDIELYYRLSFICKFDFVEEVLVHYYKHPEAMSTKFDKKLIGVKSFIDKHRQTIRDNKKPWSEINEHLAELFVLNGNKKQATKHFFIAIANRPFHLSNYVKLMYALIFNPKQYKKKRNFK